MQKAITAFVSAARGSAFQERLTRSQWMRKYATKDIRFGVEAVVTEESFGSPEVTKDGVTVTKATEFKDRFGNVGASLVNQVAVYQFEGVQTLAEICNAQSNRIQQGLSNHQYCEFEGVTEANLRELDRLWRVIGKRIRITYFNDGRMIVKFSPAVVHQRATFHFVRTLHSKMIGMGVPDKDLDQVGGTRYQGRTRSKEADMAFQPPASRQNDEWPTLVIETGYSESESKLREDAKFWLEESSSDVTTVLLFIVGPRDSFVRIEKWELVQPPPPSPQGPRPVIRAFSRAQIIPPRAPMAAMIATVNIDRNSGTVTGAPLILEFQKVFLRPPRAPEENIIFTSDDLLDWAVGVLRGY